MWILWWFERDELFTKAIPHLHLLDFSPVWFLSWLIKGELYLKISLHYSASSLWSFCPPSPGLYQSWHFLFALPEQIPQKYFAVRLSALLQASTSALHRYLMKLLAALYRAVPLTPFGQLILVWKRESTQTPNSHNFPACSYTCPLNNMQASPFNMGKGHSQISKCQ